MNETKCRSIVKARSMNLCEIGCGRQGIHAHHRKNRSQGGKWTPENIMWLCLDDHKRITEHPTEAYHFGWSVRSGFDPAETPVKWCGVWAFLEANGQVRERCHNELLPEHYCADCGAINPEGD